MMGGLDQRALVFGCGGSVPRPRDHGTHSYIPRNANGIAGSDKRTSSNLNVLAQAADLLADTQLRNDRLVTLGIVLLQVVKQTATLANHHQEAAPGGMVFLVGFEVVGQLANTLAQDRDLHFRASGVSRVRAVIVNDAFLLLSG
jgi:hypothetical protein